MAVKVGLLGAGFIGASHAQVYTAIDEAQLVAVADVKQEAADSLAERCGARAYYDVETLLADDEVEAVDVCLPTFLHERCVVAAANRRKHVLCEKPVALTLEQVDRMIAAVEAAQTIAMVAQVIRFWPQYEVIRELLESGELGKPLMATASRLAEPPGWSDWFKNPDLSGGAVVDMHIHDLDYICSLFGRPRSVYAVGLTSDAGAWDHVATSLDFGDTKGIAEASFLMPAGYPLLMAFRLLGTEGCAEYRFRVGGQVERRQEAETELVVYRGGQPPEYPPYSQEDGYVAEIRYFARCVEERKQPDRATLGDARTALEVALAARKSLETGSVVQL